MVGRGRAIAVLLFSVVLLAGTAVAGMSLFQQERAEGESLARITWSEYDVVRRGVVVHATLSACQTISDVDLVETADRVEVTLDLTGEDTCAGESVEVEKGVRLERRLRDRAVYDGGCLADGGTDERCRAAQRTTAEG
ncbi:MULTISPECIES: hypothetical protein [unclassified Nocardioides]|uniref:hypothetical protein n=1 Tax=unclassified Nocardioides TaxID=2615069 RepID=UPI0030144694